jgi:integrase
VRDRGKLACYPLSEDGTHYHKPAAKWAADVRLADGRRKRVRFSSNRDAAAMMLADLLKRIEGEKAGVIDRTAEHQKRPLTAHIENWVASLRASGRGAEYIRLKAGRVRAVVAGCGWVFPGDLSAEHLEAFLAKLRTQRPELPPLPAGPEWFTSEEVRGLLGGVSRQTVAALIRQHGLSGRGRGKTRQFPRAAVELLRGLKGRGRSSQTSNHYLQAVRQFARWLADNGRIDRSPFARLRPMNARLDQRRRRGELGPAELSALLAAAERNTAAVRGLPGPDRATLYRVAAGTGFRAAELAALVPEYFDLTAVPPAVVLPPELSKNRKGAVQPLPAALAADLQTYLTGRPAREPVWPGGWHRKAADMIRTDLAAAAVPVEVDGPEGVETRDFHALRAVFISNVIRAGADLKQAMTLARHSDPRLTANRYARTRLHDLGAVVNKLPQLDKPAPSPEPAILRMTGTDPGGPTEQPGAAPGAARSSSGRVRLRTVENDGPNSDDGPITGKTPGNPGV